MTPRIAALAFLTFASAIPANLQAEGDWKPFFSETSLEELYFAFEEDAKPEDIFELRGEEGLVVKGKGKPAGYLQTLDEFENYEITFDWRWSDEPGNGGVMLHCDADPYKSIWTHGIEIDLKHQNAGDFWLNGSKLEVQKDQMPGTTAERERRKKLVDAEKEKGLWNQMRIVAKDDTLEVHLNGKLVNKATATKPKSGFITFMAQKANLEFRSIRLREL